MRKTLTSLVAVAFAGLMVACGSPPPGAAPPDPVVVVQTGVAAARVTVDLLLATGKIKQADVDKFNAQAAAVLDLLAALGPVVSMADPKLKPALDALTALQKDVSTANTAPPPPLAPK